MPNYCTTTEMKALNPQMIYDATSKPSVVQCSSFIVGITADMDSRMFAVGISVPISTSPMTMASRNLKIICMHGAAAVAENAAFMGGNKNQSTHGDQLMEYYENAMQRIEANPGIISGTAGITLDSYEYSNVDKRRTEDEEPYVDGREDF